MPEGTPTLRYFDCRSRGQALRFTLSDAGVLFDEVRLPIAELADFRKKASDSAVGGPFASLPILDWDEFRIAQTLAIGSYLADVLYKPGPDASPEERAFLDMIMNAAHLDMQAPYSQLLWLPADCSAETLASAARQLFSLVTRRLGQLEKIFDEERAAGQFFGDGSPTVADYFVYESISRACDVFGAAFESQLSGARYMGEHKRAMDMRPGIIEARAKMPFQVTASPTEPQLRERLAEVEL